MLLASDKKTAVIGLGVTGFSCGRYLSSQGRPFIGFDENTDDDLRLRFETDFPGLRLVQGPLRDCDFSEFDQLVLSPGVPLATASITAAKLAGVDIIGDIGLFMAAVTQPVIAVTGSNGKSTVVTWLAAVLAEAGLSVGLAGNIGVSPLALLEADASYDIFVLELSSFQLEIIDRLDAFAACVLNVSEDHLDRYPNMLAYHAAKQRIYRGAKFCIVNRDEPLSQPLLASNMKLISYGLSEPDINQYGLRWIAGEQYICRGSEPILGVDQLALKGSHQLSNALAVLALVEAASIEYHTVLTALAAFKGLPHRCSAVAEIAGVHYVNDSKATNTGAAIAAIQGLAQGQNIILLAGGLAKGADLGVLRAIQSHLKALIVFGQAAPELMAVFSDKDITEVDSMQAAVDLARSKAIAGDLVLLSPACASLDMFSSYGDRGDQFAAAVNALELAYEH